MMNELMNGKACIKELEHVISDNTFMRNLTEDEIRIILDKGLYYFIHETLGMNDKEFESFKKIKRIISAYCTQSVDVYEKELENDIDIPYYTLKTIVNDMEDKFKRQEKCQDKKEQSIEDKAKSLCEILNMIPKSAHNWIECYVKYVKDHKSVLDVLKSNHSGYTDDEKCGDVLDAIKDATIDACIVELKKTGEIELDPEIMSEVTSKLWHSEDNIRINIINNKLKVEFK